MSAPLGEAGRLLERVGAEVQTAFAQSRRVLAFAEFLALVQKSPARHVRGAAQYLRDAFDHFGTSVVPTPRGERLRYHLFDQAFTDGADPLIGHEEAQGRVYRALSNFARDGRTTRLILLHGPNGSAKSTFIACLGRALEHYSTLDEGALYRFNWVFPAARLGKGGIGFGGHSGGPAGDSYAHLDDTLVDARVADELRDHPLLLLPPTARRELFAAAGPSLVPSAQLRDGDLSPKNKQIFEALLAANQGDYLKVLRHVQVERFYLSRRYRQGLVTVEPQLAVDARARQLTADRSLSALPPALQTVPLHEYAGELVEGNRGLIEYADLLKRPLEAYKYLLGTVEHGRVAVDSAILHLDTVFIGSSNDSYLAAFKELPEFPSFKGRLELVRVPYLLDFTVETRIYDLGLRRSSLEQHVAPHATRVAALWAVLTRMRRPQSDRYDRPLAELLGRLGPLDKAELYAHGRAPAGFTPEQARILLGVIDQLAAEGEAHPGYEGRSGASPREVKTLLLHAAQRPQHPCLSPLAVAAELEELCQATSVYEFLKQEPAPGGYYEAKRFVAVVLERWLDWVDEEVRTSMGLVEERQHGELFARYVSHVSHWVKKEKLANPATGRPEEPDEELMASVEKSIGAPAQGGALDFRRTLISKIGAWSIDHPNQRPDYALVFPRELGQLRDRFFEQRKKIIHKTVHDLLAQLTDGAPRSEPRNEIDREARLRVETTRRGLIERFGYCDACAREAIAQLARRRYS